MSSSVCILSGTDIREGDRVVAVLATPRLRRSPMFQEYGPIRPYHEASAASFPIRGTYGLFGSFEPDPGQASVDFLKTAVCTRDWSDLIRVLHEEGLGVEVDDEWPKRKTVKRPAAFAFVHEEIHDAVLAVPGLRIDPSPAVETVCGYAGIAAGAERGDPKRDDAVGRLISFATTGFPFGTHQTVSSASDDRIGNEILAKTVNRFLVRLVDPKDGAEATEAEAVRIFGCLAEITLFENALDLAGVVFQPSVASMVHPAVRARIAAMSIGRILPEAIVRDVENDEPTLFLDELRHLSERMDAIRSDHEAEVASISM